MSQPAPCASSTLLSALLTDLRAEPARPLVEVARTAVSVHYDTGRADVPVLCVATPAAVRLPNTLLVTSLPGTPPGWRVTRWWRPPRPHGLQGATLPLSLRPTELLGAGPGLTPAGDDVLAGALVAAHAFGHPRRAWLRAEVRDALRSRRTTAVSRGLLTHALDGWCTPELAAYVEAVGSGRGIAAADARLRKVGHTSGAALVAGVHHVVAPQPLRSVA